MAKPFHNVGVTTHQSLGSECTAFANAIRSLEKLCNQTLIPGERVLLVSLPSSYCARIQSSGCWGRPKFPQYNEQVTLLNSYMQNQKVSPGGHPNLRFPIKLPFSYRGPSSQKTPSARSEADGQNGLDLWENGTVTEEHLYQSQIRCHLTKQNAVNPGNT